MENNSVDIVQKNIVLADTNYIAHLVNCQGRMARGVAKDIRNYFPDVWPAYRKLCNESFPEDLLGSIQIVGRVINMFGQLHYGYRGTQYTNINAFRRCVSAIGFYVNENVTVAFPYKIASVRGGADWEEVQKILEELPTGSYKFYRLDKG